MLTKFRMLRQKLQARGKSNEEIFDAIYSGGGWGKTDETEDGVSSGSGSSLENSKQYVDFVVDLIRKSGFGSIVDIGCGDYRVSKRIVDQLGSQMKYTGIDVSKLIIDRNNAKFGSDTVRFVHGDGGDIDYPEADIILVREVMQHISNADILRMIPRIRQFKDNVITNSQAVSGSGKNVDIASGSMSRAAIGEGLWLENEPFNLPIVELARWRHANRNSEIVSVRIC